jgi:hypothetical protein
MSDTARPADPRPEVKKIGLLSMGIILVISGAAMLCAQLGWLPPSQFRWLLPAYLIVLGSETLISRLMANAKSPEIRLAPAVGSVAIALGVLLFIRLWVMLGDGVSTWMYW